MMIEKIFPKSPTEVLFKMSNYLQRWKILLRLAEKSKVEQMGRDGVLPEELSLEIWRSSWKGCVRGTASFLFPILSGGLCIAFAFGNLESFLAVCCC